jgi:hypothetical protein
VCLKVFTQGTRVIPEMIDHETSNPSVFVLIDT